MRNRIWWAAGAAGVLVAGGIAVYLLVDGTSQPAAARARQYTASQACLLTDAQGISGSQAATVWQGMEDASLSTHAKVTYLSVSGPATAANAIPYANSLIQRHCDVILAVGDPQTGAVMQIAHSTSKTHFVIVGSSMGSTSGNVTRLSLSPSTRSQVARAVEETVGS